MNLDQQKSILTIALLAAFADGSKDDTEREEIRRLAQSLAGDAGMADLPRIYQDVLLQRTSVQAAASALGDPMQWTAARRRPSATFWPRSKRRCNSMPSRLRRLTRKPMRWWMWQKKPSRPPCLQ